MRRPIFLTPLAIWILLAGLVFAQAAPPQTDRQPVRLRVLSYNIHHGAGVDGKLELARIATVIRSANPDLVALQEVDRGVQRSNRVDQPEQLASRTGLHVVFGNNIRYQGGDYGNAVLSRFPIARSQNHALPSFYDGEQRGVLEVEIHVADQLILFFATHLDYRPADDERLASVDFVNRLVASRNDTPALLAGDLNATPDSRTLRGFETAWTRANEQILPTYPAESPVRQIDFLLFRPASRWKPIEVRVLDEAVASDHRAILAVLELVPIEPDQS